MDSVGHKGDHCGTPIFIQANEVSKWFLKRITNQGQYLLAYIYITYANHGLYNQRLCKNR